MSTDFNACPPSCDGDDGPIRKADATHALGSGVATGICLVNMGVITQAGLRRITGRAQFFLFIRRSGRAP